MNWYKKSLLRDAARLFNIPTDDIMNISKKLSEAIYNRAIKLVRSNQDLERSAYELQTERHIPVFDKDNKILTSNYYDYIIEINFIPYVKGAVFGGAQISSNSSRPSIYLISMNMNINKPVSVFLSKNYITQGIYDVLVHEFTHYFDKELIKQEQEQNRKNKKYKKPYDVEKVNKQDKAEVRKYFQEKTEQRAFARQIIEKLKPFVVDQYKKGITHPVQIFNNFLINTELAYPLNKFVLMLLDKDNEIKMHAAQRNKILQYLIHAIQETINRLKPSNP